MPIDEQNKWNSAKLEYETAIGLFIHFSNLRRRDMAFVTTVQGAVLAIAKDLFRYSMVSDIKA